MSHEYQLLIADDDDGFRRALTEILSPFFEVVEAASGEEALDIASATEVHIALFDLHMEVVSGIEAIREFHRIHQQAPSILLTSDFTEETARDAANAHAFDILKKPVSRQTLVMTVAEAIQTAYADEPLSSRLRTRGSLAG